MVIIIVDLILFLLARTRSCVHDGCNPTNCHESAHKQQRIPNANKPSYGNTLSPDDHNDIATAFSESCRVENLAPEMHSTQHSHHNLYGVGPSSKIHTSQSPPQSHSGRPILQYTSSGSNQSSILENRNDVNMHQKLQRQLSLNPNAYDPRLVRMHNANSIQSKHSHPEQMQQEPSQVMQHTGHRQLAPSLSGPRSHMTNHWDLHQVCPQPYVYGFHFHFIPRH